MPTSLRIQRHVAQLVLAREHAAQLRLAPGEDAQQRDVGRVRQAHSILIGHQHLAAHAHLQV